MANIYIFRCEKCNKEEEREISITKYDEEKNNQFCSCGEKMTRVFTPIAGTVYGCSGFYDTNNGRGCR